MKDLRNPVFDERFGESSEQQKLPLPLPVADGGEEADGKAAHGGDDEAAVSETVVEEQRVEKGDGSGEEGGEDGEEEEEEEEGEEEEGEKGHDKFDHLEIDDDGEADDTERPKLAEDFYEIEAVRKKRVRKVSLSLSLSLSRT
ncbi:hypothetical protein TEA_003443 [Camellia sinensis var. sinensis]|uniref:Uncharacterized protein n=1 Tax=Camellia sinensis var. sinensis TaxID=542762 RepID=A0A4S4DDS2_CAMSN|nr:hypothetical protein TEA_003443 [Camellia sinensis var. sinensis]